MKYPHTRMLNRHGTSTLHRALVGTIFLAWLAVLPQHAFAAQCSFQSAVGVNFGAYDVFSPNPNNTGVGRLTIACNGGGNNRFNVALSSGQSHSHASRVMRSGTNTLNYDLFTDSACTVIWGDGTGGSSMMSVPKNVTTTLSIYGEIPPGQDVAAGLYTDNIVVTVYF
jgi:spore coat protein U-like protein